MIVSHAPSEARRAVRINVKKLFGYGQPHSQLRKG